MPKIAYNQLGTEQINPRTCRLDLSSIQTILRKINEEDKTVALAVAREMPDIARAVKLIVSRLNQKGRIIFAGAGTSGRLGVLESAECPPTFHCKSGEIQAIMAGGRKAVFKAREGAEDDAAEGRRQIALRATKKDIVIGIAASGVTPFVVSALKQAKKMKCAAIIITCNPSLPRHLPGSCAGDVIISLNTGPEAIAGSTRMKAATATKMTLNMITTAAMIKLGKVYGNRMVDLQIKSKKLKERAIAMIEEIAQVKRRQAIRCLQLAHGRAKAAIVMAKKNMSYIHALRLLTRSRGSLRQALDYRGSD